MLTVRRLTLRTEHLTELSSYDLAAVAGGAGTQDCIELTRRCFTGYYPSINADCTTLIENLTTGDSLGC